MDVPNLLPISRHCSYSQYLVNLTKTIKLFNVRKLLKIQILFTNYKFIYVNVNTLVLIVSSFKLKNMI